MSHDRLRKLIIFMVAWLLSGAGQAGPPSRFPWTLNHYQHTAFTKKDGAPQATMVMAETSDGYLWVNDVKGLVRFDGARFQPFSPRPGESLPGKQVSNLFAPKTGGLWLSFGPGGVGFISHDHITNYQPNEGKQTSSTDFYEDRQGNVIAYFYPGLMKFNKGRWTPLDVDIGTLDIRNTCQDADFNIWAVSRRGRLLVLREGTHQFVDLNVDVNGAISVSAGPSHAIFVSTRSQLIRRYVDNGSVVEIGKPFPYYARRVVVDRSGYVWLGTANDGAHFMGAAANLPSGDAPFPVDEHINTSGGLTGNFASVFEDHKGTIWIGTDRGLDRLAPSPFSQLALPFGLTMVSIIPGKWGDAWIGSENFPTRHLERDVAAETIVPGMVMTSHTAADGSVYAATAEDLWQLAPGAPRILAELPVKGVAVVRAITQGSKGELLLSFRGKDSNVASLDHGKWIPIVGLGRPASFLAEQSGIIWAGIGKNLLASYNEGEIKKYSAADGLSAGDIKTIAAHDGLLWLGGDQRLQAFRGGKFTTLKLAGAHELSDISGVVFDQENNLWVHTIAGLVRIDRVDVRRAIADPGYAAPFRLFDTADGLPGVPAQTYTLPTLRLGGDGRLWVTGQTAAAWLDPRSIVPPPPLNAPVIEQISDGENDYDLSAGDVRLPKIARDLQITYTTPELQFPERVRFQYRLRGFDDKWQDAGNERKASYPHLSGGAYLFEVRSAHDGEAWTGRPSSVAFAIALRYYETWWFRLCMAAVVALALLGLVRFQMRIATYRERGRMQIRLDEREAVARDLHDTLLQSNQAVVLQLHALASGVVDPELKAKLAHLTQISQSATVEGRDKVDMLRSAVDDGIALIAVRGKELSAEYGIEFKLEVKGTQLPLAPQSCHEMVPMANELLINAFRHSKATVITAAFTFGWWRFRVAIRDDGVGIASAIVAAGAPRGHWGLQGVRERAERLGARVIFRRMKPAGSEIAIAIPARRIYLSARQTKPASNASTPTH